MDGLFSPTKALVLLLCQLVSFITSMLLVFELRKSFRRLSQSGRTKSQLPMSSKRLLRTTSVLLVLCPLLLLLNAVSCQKGWFSAPVVHRRLLSPRSCGLMHYGKCSFSVVVLTDSQTRNYKNDDVFCKRRPRARSACQNGLRSRAEATTESQSDYLISSIDHRNY